MVNRKLRTTASLFLALWLLLTPYVHGGTFSFAQDTLPQDAASDGITIVNNTVRHSFAQQITFTLEATSDAEITQVYLFFQVRGGEHTWSESVDIEPAREINISYMHDLRRSPLPPFAIVTFWWNIEDTAGDQLNTASAPGQFTYTDDRFQWEELSDGGVTVHWIQGHGDPIFGQAALDVARASVEEINAELRAPVPESIDVYIYDTQPNLDAAMILTGREWVVGQAHPELGIVVVAIPFESSEGYMGRMKRYIPHEITHLLVYQAVQPSGYRYVPEWLDEGLATANERLPTTEHALVLDTARTQEQLLPLEDLCVPFPPNPQTAFLAYAQSGSLVKFIRERYGAEGIRDLLAAYHNGASCAVGVQEALNVSLSGLETAWQASLEPKAPWRAIVEQVGVWAGLWLLSVLLAAPMIGRLRHKR
jgi:hypothetical protein